MSADAWTFCPFCKKEGDKENQNETIRIDGVHDWKMDDDGVFSVRITAYCKKCFREWKIETSVKPKGDD
jgi:hypothetical protein